MSRQSAAVPDPSTNVAAVLPNSPTSSRKRAPKKLGPKNQDKIHEPNGASTPQHPQQLPIRGHDEGEGISQPAGSEPKNLFSSQRHESSGSQAPGADHQHTSQAPSQSQSQSRRRRSRGRRRGKTGAHIGTDTSGSDSQRYQSDMSGIQLHSGAIHNPRRQSDAHSAASSDRSEPPPQGGRKKRQSMAPHVTTATAASEEGAGLDTVEEAGEGPNEAREDTTGALHGLSGSRRRGKKAERKSIRKREDVNGVQNEREKEEEKTLKLRLDLDLDLEIELKAVIKGSVTLSLLT